MGVAVRARSGAAAATFAEADQALGFSLSALCEAGPQAQLTQTAYAQPAILTTSIAELRAAQALGELARPGVDFQVVAGHSLGEWSALVAAGVVSFAQAVTLVHLRGTFMQRAVPEGAGAMAAVVGLSPEQIATVCVEASEDASSALGERAVPEVVEVANFNGGGQVVISGATAAVDRAIVALKARGARRAIKLAVSAPFHCALMETARAAMADALADVPFRDAIVPVVTNVEATPETRAGRLKALVIEQVTAPVRWEASVQAMAAMGITHAYELGEGEVLTGLVKRIAPQIAMPARATQ